MKLSSLFFAAFFLFAQNAIAQYNKTYELSTFSGGIVESIPLDMVTAGNGDVCVLSTEYILRDKIELKRLDFSGNVIWNYVYEFPSNVGNMYPFTMVRTDDNGFMVCGMVYENISNAPNITTNPFVAKFNANGIFQWFSIIQSNPTYFWYHSAFARANIIRTKDDPNESYIIVAPGADHESFIDHDDYNVLNAAKIDANGSVVWNRRYGNSLQGLLYCPHTIACGEDREVIVHDDNTVEEIMTYKYFIAGTHLLGNDRKGFDLTIDGNGNIIDQFRNYWVPTYPMLQEAIYDASTKEFVMAQTLGNTNLVGGPNASVIGITKLDFSTLNIKSTDYYWQPGTVENYGKSIVENPNGDGYAIYSWISGDTAIGYSHVDLPSVYFWSMTPALLQVDKTGAVTSFVRYNKFKYSGKSNFTASLLLNNNGLGTWNYVMGSVTNILAYTTCDIRVISTDLNGYACGAEDIQYGQNTLGIDPEPIEFPEHFIEPMNINIGLSSPDYRLTTTICDISDGSNTDYYRTTGINNSNKPVGINVFPTLMTDDNNTLNFELNVTADAKLSVTLFDISGKLIATKIFNAKAGNEKLKWELPQLQTSNYVVRITSDDATLQHVVKLSKL